MYSDGDSQHIFLLGLSSHNLKAINDFPVPVRCITAAFCQTAKATMHFHMRIHYAHTILFARQNTTPDIIYHIMQIM